MKQSGNMSEHGHGGIAIAAALNALGVDHLFALTGGHLFPIFDGCVQKEIRIVDTRHEQTAAFAAEGWARLTRSLGVGAVTAGPGVTNAMSAMAQARFNAAPVLMLGGRAPAFRWGAGSLQEIDHVPFVDPIAPASTVSDVSKLAGEVVRAGVAALKPPRGPRFLDFPLDILMSTTDLDVPEPDLTLDAVAPGRREDSVMEPPIAELIEASERPVIIAGSNVYLDGAEDELTRLVERRASLVS